jgi:lipoate-protein ligase A
LLGGQRKVVKRLTGGGFVLHDKDLTLSLSLPGAGELFPSDVKTSYLKVNEALRWGLRKIYPDLDFADCKNVPSGRGDDDRICFENPSCYDLLLKGKKVVGASQRRKDGAILHQATIFLDAEHHTLTKCIQEGFEEKWGVVFEESALEPDELREAEKRELERYGAREWSVPPVVKKKP